MATPNTPMLQSVLLWQHNQTTTPNLPTGASVAAPRAPLIDLAKPATQSPEPTPDPVDNPPFDTVEEEEKDDEENEESDEEQNA